MSKYYILDGHMPVAVDHVFAWARWKDEDQSRVALTAIGDVRVSTVFLGLDLSYGDGPPILFETMVFGLPDEDEPQERYATWEEAEAGHERMVAWVRETMEVTP